MTRSSGKTIDRKKTISTMQDFKNVSKDSNKSGKRKEIKHRNNKKIDFIIRKFKYKINEMSMGIAFLIQFGI